MSTCLALDDTLWLTACPAAKTQKRASGAERATPPPPATMDASRLVTHAAASPSGAPRPVRPPPAAHAPRTALSVAAPRAGLGVGVAGRQTGHAV